MGGLAKLAYQESKLTKRKGGAPHSPSENSVGGEAGASAAATSGGL